MKKLPRFAIVVFDALRRDMITARDMPHLRRFVDEGCDFPQSRCVFPSETRVNAASLVCGAAPTATGVVANRFFDARIHAHKLFNSAQHEDMQAAERAYDGGFVTSPTLGDVLAGAGRTLAVVSSGTAGVSHVLNPRSQQLRQVTLALSDWRRSAPAPYANELLEQFGPIPAAGTPNVERIRLQMDMVLERVLPDVAPDGLVVWLSDPDSTYHACGIGSPQSIAAIRNTDVQFGRFLDCWQRHPERDACTVVVCSDHGQISVRHRVSVLEQLAASGLDVAAALDGGAALAGRIGYAGVVHVAQHDDRRIASIARWLLAQPWCGNVFTANGDGVRGAVAGTLDRALLMLEHERTPDLYYTMRADAQPNDWGLPGTCWADVGDGPAGGGVHGGLHRIEMNNLLALQGSRYKRGYRSPWPAGIIDVAPTLLAELGLPLTAQMTGRVLSEACVQGSDPPAPRVKVARAEAARTAQCLRQWRVGTATYIDQGWVEG